MTTVFLDSVGLLAVWNASDQWHEIAKVAFKEIALRRMSVITSTFILLECGNMAARRPFRRQVIALRFGLEKRQQLVTPSEDDWKNAWSSYEKSESGNAGIVDQVSFAIMRRLGIKQAFTNDKHFEAAGFEVLF